jgi:PhoPQ-activated pathogenicity-related protein
MGAEFVRMAAVSGAVVAQLNQVPNQPLTFAHTGKRVVEDGILAEGWKQFLETGDTKWLGRLPMTKSAVRAMDAVTEFLGSEAGGGVRVSYFVPAGGSKRGWTAWMVAAVDARVRAVIPIVIDLLNLIPSFEHHYAVYGFWAPAIDDYTQRGIMEWMHTPEYRAMLDIVDPYSYRARLTMPKMVINAADDQFFLPDSWRFYWDDLQGPKYLRYVPNAGHGLGGSDAASTISAFFHSIVSGTPLPEYAWRMGDDGVLSVESRTAPLRVLLWRATNPASRDFRLETVGNEAWTAEPVEGVAGRYAAKLEAPPAGYSAYLMELEYAGPGEATLKLTTPVYILPDKVEHVYPEPDPLPQGFMTRAK